MRRSSVALMVLLLLTSSAPAIDAASKGVISCTPADLEMIPASWDIDDGACVRVDLGVLSAGDTLSFDVTADSQVDILLFAAGSISVYQNEQNYRLDSVWHADSVFESFQGDGTWHWTAPDDRGDTRWYLVLDNMAHPQDQGNGAQGGSLATVVLDIQEVDTPVFGIVDTIVRLDSGGHSVLAGPLVLDQGTQVNLFVTTMQGAPDIFLMTDVQLEFYEQGTTANGMDDNNSDMLLVLEERSLSWSVSSDYTGQDLYLVVDNRPGPPSGGAGTGFVATTVVMDLIPILEPTITNASSLATIDVGAEVILDASSTPNLSNQIDSETGFQWDTNGDGFYDTAGSAITVSWDEPNQISIGLRAVSKDGRSATIYLNTTIEDISPPEVSLSASDTIRKDFDDELLLTANIDDNWGVYSVEWLVDEEVIENYSSWSWQDGKTFTFRFDSSYSPGEHEVTIRVTDKEGQVTERTAIIDLYDSTPPVVPQQTVETTVILGEPFQFTAEAMDAESPNLLYYWDFDTQTDANSDGIMDNDMDASGSAITRVFEERGTFEIVCTIVNDAGVSTQVTYFVTVRSTSDGGPELDAMMLGIGAVLLLLLIIAGVGMIAWRRMSNARLEALLEEQAAGEEEKPRELSVDEQKAMYGTGSATLDQPASMSTTSPFGQYATGMSGASDPQATISQDAAMGDVDLEALMSSPEPITASGPSSPASDLLAEFSTDDSAVEGDSLEYSHDEASAATEQVWSPQEVDALDQEDSLPKPPPPEPEPEADALLDDDDLPTPPAPETEELPSPPPPVEVDDELEMEEESDEPEEEVSEPISRVVQQDCSQCQQRFEVTLPDGHDVARTACPSCGAIETVSFS
ncbi:MAG: zinc ribbon domain-containing protein [Candidatus Thermoplasmatota archaeon]|nr:zinc ribbon domain-containing protein [Candidatus Thermoplasmatota archaeon]MEC9393613.1 zinc ribbon domain-containing protein [Candidatus Thermoplasmatota archaeon]MED6312391.1 zinc ribbon domain-containing protein [Candidatus Thermoplasmatota archaeon]MEE3304275.1 zinc ribbon domain-containing protein [Candidatus Thermoplasmatota archaeon]